MNNRVNGVLAVTRSLGDAAMKEFVVGSPYTTETSLSDEDSFLIVACDGVSLDVLGKMGPSMRDSLMTASNILHTAVGRHR